MMFLTQSAASIYSKNQNDTWNIIWLKRLLQLRFDFDSTMTKNEHVNFFVASRGVVANKKAVGGAYNDRRNSVHHGNKNGIHADGSASGSIL